MFLGASVMATATGCLTHSPTRKVLCDQSETFSRFSESSSLVIPTMEASVRAMRLVSTAFRIVLDYQVAKVGIQLPFTVQSEEECEIKELEARVERLELKLEEAQIEYSSGTKSKETTRDISVEERRMQEVATDLANAEQQLISKEDLSTKSRLNRKSAKRLLDLCRENGGVYIKVGQHLANLDYIVPREYIEVLSSLFNDAPQSGIDNVYRVIEEDLGSRAEELFDDFDPNPIASASLAQVHVAYCKKTKRKLAVKVQHRGLRETSAGDLFAVTRVVRVIDSLFTDFTFGWIADEMAPQLPKELDFKREGRNAEEAALQIEKSGLACCIPKVMWENTSSRVLTMEFEEGFKSTDIESLEASGLKKR
jgi:predicted unusual protein kinase regulating ubiquinone biosynthesis (AarF/ABC1/UbiB family)